MTNINSGEIAFGGFPKVMREIEIAISGLEEWKDGVVTGANVRVDIIQAGEIIHSEFFSGKSTQGFTKTVKANASLADLEVVHNRPDLPNFKVCAGFVQQPLGFVTRNGQVFINQSFIQEAPSNRSDVYTVNMGVSLNDKKSTTDKVREIVAKYLTSEAKEYEDELVEELKVLIEKESDCTLLATIISEQVRQRLKKEMQPGGLLHKR